MAAVTGSVGAQWEPLRRALREDDKRCNAGSSGSVTPLASQRRQVR